jgi:DNA-binding NtrC family response regulator
MSQPAILLIEPASALSTTLSTLLMHSGFAVLHAADLAGLRALFEKGRPEVVILGPSMIDPAGTLTCASEIRRVVGGTPIVLIARVSSEELAINALRAGINEYVKSLSSPDEIVLSIRRCLADRVSLRDPWNKLPQLKGPQLEGLDRMIGDSAPMREVRMRLGKAASTDSNILITGETGTGKELIAELLHSNGPRREKPFIPINCAAIPDSLFESELFGYERGAFTGAYHSKDGKLKAADGGTVFLDEIGDMSPYGQSKMLRMIESREIQRLGSNCGTNVDVRIIAATNRNLENLAEENTFRKDLFFRLSVVSIHLPPLRERKEDLLSLLDYQIRYYNKRFKRSLRCLSDEAVAYVLAYDWPGNIRELKNLVETIFVELPAEDTAVAELPAQFRSRCLAMNSASRSERERLVRALLSTNWNKSKAASSLHWSRMTLYRKLAQYNIQRNSV